MERIPLSARASWVERLKKEWRKNALVYIVMIPVLVHFLIFQALPLIGSFLLSFMNWPIIGEPEFVGLKNWERLISDDLAWRSLWNTTLFTLYYVVPTMAMGLILALLVHQKLHGAGFFKGIFFFFARRHLLCGDRRDLGLAVQRVRGRDRQLHPRLVRHPAASLFLRRAAGIDRFGDAQCF